MGASAGVFAQLGIAATSPVNVGYDFISHTLSKKGSIIEHNGLRGTRSRHGGRTRAGNFAVGGTIVMEPCPEEWATLLPWILGADASGTTFALAETVPARYVTIDNIAKVPEFAGCYVNRAVISSSEGSPLRLELDIIGKTETVGAAASFPSLTLSNTAPFIHTDSTLTMVSSARSVKSVRLTIDNNLIAAFNNSVSASFIVAGDRMISVDTVVPYSSSEIDLYDQAAAGAAATLAYAYAGYSMSIALANLQIPNDGPTNQGRGSEVALNVAGMTRMATTTKELIITLDSTA